MANRKTVGLIETTLIVYGGIALAVLAAGTALWFNGDSYGQAKIQAKWDGEKAKAVLEQERLRKERVDYTAKLVREGLDAQAEIAQLAFEIKAKGTTNETSKLCPAAPSGSVLVTPDRLRDLKSLYRK